MLHFHPVAFQGDLRALTCSCCYPSVETWTPLCLRRLTQRIAMTKIACDFCKNLWYYSLQFLRCGASIQQNMDAIFTFTNKHLSTRFWNAILRIFRKSVHATDCHQLTLCFKGVRGALHRNLQNLRESFYKQIKINLMESYSETYRIIWNHTELYKILWNLTQNLTKFYGILYMYTESSYIFHNLIEPLIHSIVQ